MYNWLYFSQGLLSVHLHIPDTHIHSRKQHSREYHGPTMGNSVWPSTWEFCRQIITWKGQDCPWVENWDFRKWFRHIYKEWPQEGTGSCYQIHWVLNFTSPFTLVFFLISFINYRCKLLFWYMVGENVHGSIPLQWEAMIFLNDFIMETKSWLNHSFNKNILEANLVPGTKDRKTTFNP